MNPPLFCKPAAGTGPSQLLYTTVWKPENRTISFRSLDINHDLALIHSWITQPYTAKYWQLNVDTAELKNIYQSILDSPCSHSYIGLLENQVVCQIDCYHVSAEEINAHIDSIGKGDAGLHILMCPPRQSRKGLTEAMLRAFTEFFFAYAEAQTLYGEPDAHNRWGNIAAERAGFQFQKTIALSYKTANLYAITREQFFKSVSHEK